MLQLTGHPNLPQSRAYVGGWTPTGTQKWKEANDLLVLIRQSSGTHSKWPNSLAPRLSDVYTGSSTAAATVSIKRCVGHRAGTCQHSLSSFGPCAQCKLQGLLPRLACVVSGRGMKGKLGRLGEASYVPPVPNARSQPCAGDASRGVFAADCLVTQSQDSPAFPPSPPLDVDPTSGLRGAC